MFGRIDNTTTEHRQRIDNALNDKVIEREIKACQQENGECMKSTSKNLRDRYGNRKVTRVLARLRQRNYRKNKKTSQGLGHLTEYLNQFQYKI
tara:strand:- start:344 stop:622 length:279 start_codon:yes stop_codon:yes gene_type:complete